MLECRAFYIPGDYSSPGDDAVMRGGVYVERWRSGASGRRPVVMIHGGSQTGTCYTVKPDGGEGWAQDFARAGHAVYVMDEVGCGRSPPAADPEVPPRPPIGVSFAERMFTAVAHHALWPSAALHTQWPGTGRRGDPAFDRFVASQVPMPGDGDRAERETAAAIVALLEEIGPAVLITHSLGGPRGWLAADIAPELVAGIVAVEPMGSAFYWTPELEPIFGLPPGTVCHPWGITRTPIAYDPPVSDAAALLAWWQDGERGQHRRLPNLASVPVAVVSAEASYHRSSDLDLTAFLTATGVENELVCLEDRGLRGNGHMMMLEENSAEIAALIVELISGW